MSRSFFLLPLSLAMLVGCGDPYAVPRTDGGPGGEAGPGSDAAPIDEDASTTDGAPIGEDTGKLDTAAPVDTGPVGSPCTTPGKTESGSCGKCGKRVRVCNSDNTWSEWSACEGEGVCLPGQTESLSCGTGGTRTRTCSSSCSWGSYGECIGGAPTCGYVGKTESEPCGKCGTRTRTCEASGWGSWGACTGEGVCTAGTTDSASCGTGGTKTRTCTSSCTWGSYGECVGGTPLTACASGTVRQTFSSSTFSGMWGCAGKVSWSSASSLCSPGYHLCTAAEFSARRSWTTPNHHYWVSDYLAGSGSEGACKASKSTTYDFCPSSAPMRVCTSTKYDASGNFCTWVGCGLESTTSSLYFGGCNDDGTGAGLKAGALCCN